MASAPYTLDITGIKTGIRSLEATKQGLSQTKKHDKKWIIRAAQRARVLAPEDTGKLRQSIDVDFNNMTVTAGGKKAPYAVAQEFGFTPHWVHSSQWMGSQPLSSAFARVRRHTSFFRPAMKQVLGQPTAPRKYMFGKRKWVQSTINKTFGRWLYEI